MSAPHRLPTPSREVLRETEKIPPHIDREIKALRAELERERARLDAIIASIAAANGA